MPALLRLSGASVTRDLSYGSEVKMEADMQAAADEHQSRPVDAGACGSLSYWVGRESHGLVRVGATWGLEREYRLAKAKNGRRWRWGLAKCRRTLLYNE
jgi:hypothetical protein